MGPGLAWTNLAASVTALSEHSPFRHDYVIVRGDFVQLPPYGTSLATVPAALLGRVSGEAAQSCLSLVWDDITHLIELVTQKRVMDDWYGQVLAQMRDGRRAIKP